MPAQPARKLTLTDAMILVAAAAIGLAGIRAELTKHLHPSVLYFERPLELPQFDPSTRSTPLSLPVYFTSVSLTGPINGLGGYSSWFTTAQGWSETARLATPCLASLSLAMLLIRFHRPRPPRARLVRQAGTVASLGATLALGVQLIHSLLKLLIESSNPRMLTSSNGPLPSRLSWVACQTTQPHLIGVVVLSSWLVLALGGRRRERGWIDLAGIAVGVGWVALLLFDLFRNEPA